MHNSKLFYSFAVAGLIAFSNASTAAVYDFGNLRTASRTSTATNSSFSDDEFASSLNFGFTALDQPQNSFVSGHQGGATPVYSANGSGLSGLPSIDSGSRFRRGIRNKLSDDNCKYTTVTSPVPEPETYAMILAGIALIGFTARRRKQDS